MQQGGGAQGGGYSFKTKVLIYRLIDFRNRWTKTGSFVLPQVSPIKHERPATSFSIPLPGIWNADEMYRSHSCFLGFPQLCKKGLQVHQDCSSFLECRPRHFRETALFSWLTGRDNADSVTVIPALSFAYKFCQILRQRKKQNLCWARQFYLGAIVVLWAPNWIVFAISKHINFIFNLPLVLIFFKLNQQLTY